MIFKSGRTAYNVMIENNIKELNNMVNKSPLASGSADVNSIQSERKASSATKPKRRWLTALFFFMFACFMLHNLSADFNSTDPVTRQSLVATLFNFLGLLTSIRSGFLSL